MKPSSILSSPARDRGVADLPDQRQERILGEVARNGGARVSELTELLGVSDMTVRRDLDTLARRGLVRKVHGGATLPRRGSSDEPGFEAKSGQERPAKDAIARRAAEFVEPGTAVAVTAGTTTHALAHYLARVPELTVVTNSLPVAEVLDAAGRTRRSCSAAGSARPLTRWSGRWRCARSVRCTSTGRSWGCTASTPRPASPRPTCWRPRPTAPCSPRPAAWWCWPTTRSGRSSCSAPSPPSSRPRW